MISQNFALRQTCVKLKLLLLFGVVAPGLTAAQTTPDAGSLLQRMERERVPQLPRAQPPQMPAQPTPMKAPPGLVVTVKAFRFAGNTLLSDAQLAPVVAEYLNRPLDFTELQAAAAAVAKAYRNAGWVVRAYLPKQEINDGIVTIQIVEAVFGQVLREGPVPTRLKFDHVLSTFRAQQAEGQPVNGDALDRALMLIDDLPGVTATGSLREGARDGETDLILKLADEPLLTGEVLADNSGVRSTGAQRVGANVSLNSPLGLGDLLSANLVSTDGSDYARLGFTVPVGYDGWRVGGSAAHLGYRLTASDFAALNARGTSDSSGLEASYPMIRSRLKNLYLALNYDQKAFDNQSNGITATHYKSEALTLGLNANLFDTWGGGGANGASLALVNGNLNLNGSPNQGADATTTRSAGSYTKLHYSFSRQQVLTGDVSFFVAWSGQIASKNLDSSEKFYLGGPAGVRAYPTSEGGGSDGTLVNLELRRRLPEGFSLTGFYDWGQVSVNHDNRFAGAAAPNTYQLQGVGVSLAWQSNFGLYLKAILARRLGSNPNPTLAGNDQDGSLTMNRFWFTATQVF